ncbi:spore protease YyaC [Alkaliphilus serpentinus]|uniref:Spore protease YyaC n=1 Tax=Alkaliphilus serpentinus TaxID=1482731 RepID=A0A833HQR9_9FIRM|nr:spore protease YyaC [Alkaliphilus serpentinus]KAB3532207.1 spore protease YyaC [Alkaliphilus serpentinus]
MSLIKTSSDSININMPMAYIDFSSLLIGYLKEFYKDPFEELIILCIGTDRSTGDSLGPLIGYKLTSTLSRYPNVFVYGTLDEPVHAKNLDEKINYIYSNYKSPFIIAIDACLGKMDRIGYIKIGNGPLKPGAGVNKDLTAVGDLHITGIVNLSGYMEYLVLQNTRLSLVMKMAETISEGLKFSLWKLNKHRLLVQT